MIILRRPDGGHCWVHESRVNEYLGKGFAPFPAPEPSPAAEPEKEPAAPKKTRRKRNTTE